jgi:hypothetical protein
MAVDEDDEVEFDDHWSASCNKDEGHEGRHYLVLDPEFVDDEEF